ERIEERLFALRAAGRKYNAPVDDLAALAARYASDLALIDAGAVRLAALELTAADCAEAYAKAAATLSERRRGVAEMLDKAVSGELKPLKLERAKFSTAIESDVAAAGSHGIDRVEFWVRTNPGTQPGPLMKVASGGELARFLLALKVVIADKGSAPTLVFDEIDTGVGGAVADAIGVRRGRLGRRVRALAVPHAPQVAARADHHYLITKDATAKGKRVATRVTELEPARRREEIARMLAGAEITAEARAAAERLIKAAAGGGSGSLRGGRSTPEDTLPKTPGAWQGLLRFARNDKSLTHEQAAKETRSRRRPLRKAGQGRVRTAAGRDRGARPALLPGRCADRFGCRIRRAAQALQR